MRTLSALLVALLLCSLQLTSSAPAAVFTPDCCTKLTDMKIPLKMVESFSWTSSECAIKAIVFHTKKGKRFCVNPDAVWVESHKAALDKHTQ